MQLELRALPSVDFTAESMFDNPSGTVIRRISDFNSEFGLDVAELRDSRRRSRVRRRSRASASRRSSREKIFQVLVQVAKALLQTRRAASRCSTP